jgi:RNA polymerase sigma factor (sigma-70 family)
MANFQAKELTVHWPLINRIAERRFGDTNLAEEAALFVLNQLEKNNCERLQSFQGRSKLSTYISSITIRLLEDFSRHKFGRARPPAWISRLGGIWVTLFQLLCLQRYSLVEAVETMMNTVAERRKEQIEETALTILERVVHCGEHQALEVSREDRPETVEEQNLNKGHKDPETQLLEREQQILFTLLFGEKATPAAVQDFSSILRNPVQLSARERLLLKLCFQEELSVTRAGKMMGMNSNQVHGRLRRLLSRLREEFEQAGISRELRTLLAAP